MKYPFKLVSIGISVLFLGVLLSNAEQVKADSTNPSYLFALSGKSGSLYGDVLTLNGVPNVIYFTDRPERKAGNISLEKFIDSWNKGNHSFKADPPNATLSILNKDGALNVVVELMSVEQKSSSLHFKVVELEGKVNGKFDDAMLYVDARLDGLILN